MKGKGEGKDGKPPPKGVAFKENPSDAKADPKLNQAMEDEKARKKLQDIKLRLRMEDEKMYNKILEFLEEEGPREVLLTGKAGIGKTRLAKLVSEEAVARDKCFLTICLHLNQKFKDADAADLSRLLDEPYDEKLYSSLFKLYENIASQLSVYSDFEESEVDDRDEDEEEEKKLPVLLEDLKKKIVGEIRKKDKILADKEKAKKRLKIAAEEKNKNTDAATTPDGGEEKVTSTGYLLLILDDVGNKSTANKSTAKEVMEGLGLMSFLKKDCFPENDMRLKILVTKRDGGDEPTQPVEETEVRDTTSGQGSDDQESEKSDSEIQPAGGTAEESETPQAEGKAPVPENDEKGVPPTADGSKVATTSYDGTEFQSKDESQALLDSINESNLKDLFRSLTDWEVDDAGLKHFVEKSNKSPAAIFVLARSLNQISQNPSFSGKKDEVKEKMREVLSADRPNDPFNPILHLAYVLLDNYAPWKDTILDCFWHSLDFFEHCGCVYYRDLITQWILEGYFDPVKSVEKTYQEGHSILMELINRGMLKIQENNVVVPEMAMSNLIDPRPRGHLGRSRLAFSRVYAGDKKKGIGKITQIDDMIKTVQAKKGDKLTTILVSGDRLRRVTSKKYFAKLGDLEVVGLFEPTLDPSIPALFKLDTRPSRKELELLRVLIIRDCDLLDSIEDLKYLKGLNALEVSGASSLKEISHTFFKALTKLQSLHLSGLKITFSPSSISDLLDLHCLIIRDCPLLEDLPDIQELVKLEVVDISGAHGLQTCFDNTKGEKKNKSKNKNFYHLTKLQLLDFSESQIERLPIFQDSAKAESLESVTRLLLRDCSKLRRLPSLKPLSRLQILDLSGTTSLVEMLEVCYEDKKELITLNLSHTNLNELATTINELTGLKELLLKAATNLETIPNIETLTNLEVIDVSGCTKLREIEGSFEKMHYLREVDLSGSQVTILPESLPSGSNIHCVKRLTLANGTVIERETWDEVKAAMPSQKSDEASSSSATVKSQKGPEKKPEEEGEIKPDEPSRPSVGAEEGDVSKERLLQVPKDKSLYNKTLSVFDSASYANVVEIDETSELNWDTLANAEFLSFVDITSTRLASIFEKAKSVKGCWLAMCLDIMDIKDLFADVADESLESLETLSITNFPSLETISCGGRFKNLKNLSIDCCPKIKTIFPEASQLPSTLIVLHIKHCEKFEKVVEGVETDLEVTRIPESKESPDISAPAV